MEREGRGRGMKERMGGTVMLPTKWQETGRRGGKAYPIVPSRGSCSCHKRNYDFLFFGLKISSQYE
jgi:hypothetical protein